MKRLRTWVHILFRYRGADLYMLLGYLMAFLALFLALSMFEDAWDYNSDRKKYSYASTYHAKVYQEDKNVEEWLPEISEGNVTLAGVSFFVSTDKDSFSMPVDIVVQKKEKIPYLEGLKGTGGIILGRAVADVFGVSVGDAVEILHEKVAVAAILGANKSEYCDGMAILMYEDCGSVLKNALRGIGAFTLRFESNKVDAHELFLEFADHAKVRDAGVETEGIYGEADSGYGMDMTALTFYILIYAFAMLNCVIASDMWVYVRKDEVAIKQCQGYSLGRLCENLIAQSLRIGVFAVAVCFLVQKGLTLIGSSLLGIELHISLRNVLILAVMTVFTAFFSIAFSLRTIRKTVVEQLKSEDRR